MMNALSAGMLNVGVLTCLLLVRIGCGADENHALDFGQSVVDDFVRIDDAPDLHLQTLTVEMWVRPTEVRSGTLVSKALDDQQADSFTLYVRPGGEELRWWCYYDGGAVTIPNPLQDGIWTHLAATHSPTENRLYVNGELQESSAGGTITFDDHPVLIGADIASEQVHSPFYGVIDEVQIWSIARTDDEIRATFRCRLVGDEPGLLAYWPLDEGEGQVARDLSGHGHDGVLGYHSGSDSGDPAWVDSDAPRACPADVNGDRTVDFTDILILLAFWGPCDPVCVGDIDGDGEVSFADLVLLLSAWGECG